MGPVLQTHNITPGMPDPKDVVDNAAMVDAGIATLSRLGLPQVHADRVLLFGPTKAERRAAVERGHRIILQLGDTLHDFDGVFRKAATDVKRAEVDRNAAHFGADWIVFPNATYGDWSTAPLTAWDAPLKTQ